MLQAIQLTKQYQQHTALDQLNLQVGKGEIFCLLGQNGAGKTTTINLFLGFLEATSGQVLINGAQVVPGSAGTRKWIAYIPEIVMLYGQLTGIENLRYFSKLAGFNYDDKALTAFLLKSGLQQEAHRKRVQAYSKGMRQKVGIAIALAKNAAAIFMDEPTSGLDPHATEEFTAIVKEMSSEGKTIFMATHDIFNAVNLGGTIGIMRNGKLVHVLHAGSVSAMELQQLYLETIR